MKNLRDMKVFIVGLGQIGGSIGMELVQKKLVAEVIGFDKHPRITELARSKKVIHSKAHSLEDGISRADLVILATPIRKIIEIIPDVCRRTSKSKGILNVAGTKSEILKIVQRQKGNVNYISGHPLAGNERCGIQAAESGKFKGSYFALVPARGTSRIWLNLTRELVKALGAKPLLMKAGEHDSLIALTSNLPYLFSIALTQMAIRKGRKHRKIWSLVGGSFRSATRVAASSPELTLDMLMTNRHEISNKIDEVVAEFTTLREMIAEADEPALKSLIGKVKKRIGVIHDG